MITTLENHLWQSTLSCCVVAVLTLMLRRNRAAVRHGLWLAASVKFLVPFPLLVGLASQLEWQKPPCGGSAAILSGRTGQPALRNTGSSTSIGFRTNHAEPASRHTVRCVAMRICRARSGVVAT